MKLSILLLLSLLLFCSFEVGAVPAFARQTNNDCSACHYQHFPKLKPFGRKFKANGFSMTAQEGLKGDNLSLPPSLNAAFVMRSRYIRDSSEREGELEVPEEGAILVGGRIAEGIGGVVEWGGPLLSAKVNFTKPIAGKNNRTGMTLFTTDGLGAGYGFELMNTGAVRNLRAFGQSAKPTLGNNDNLDLSAAATGFAFYLASTPARTGKQPAWFFAATLYTPDSNEAGMTEMDVGSPLSTYLRAAYMPRIAGMEAGFGVGIYSGKSRATLTDDGAAEYGATAGDVFDLNTNAYFIDAQLQGKVKNRDLGVYFMYAVGDDPSTTAGEVNLYGSVTAGDSKPKGWGIDTEYSINPELHILASLGQHDNGGAGSAKQSIGLGVYWLIAQNITMQAMIETFDGDQGEDANGDSVVVSSTTLEVAF